MAKATVFLHAPSLCSVGLNWYISPPFSWFKATHGACDMPPIECTVLQMPSAACDQHRNKERNLPRMLAPQWLYSGEPVQFQQIKHTRNMKMQIRPSTMLEACIIHRNGNIAVCVCVCASYEHCDCRENVCIQFCLVLFSFNFTFFGCLSFFAVAAVRCSRADGFIRSSITLCVPVNIRLSMSTVHIRTYESILCQFCPFAANSVHLAHRRMEQASLACTQVQVPHANSATQTQSITILKLFLSIFCVPLDCCFAWPNKSASASTFYFPLGLHWEAHTTILHIAPTDWLFCVRIAWIHVEFSLSFAWFAVWTLMANAYILFNFQQILNAFFLPPRHNHSPSLDFSRRENKQNELKLMQQNFFSVFLSLLYMAGCVRRVCIATPSTNLPMELCVYSI